MNCELRGWWRKFLSVSRHSLYCRFSSCLQTNSVYRLLVYSSLVSAWVM